MKFELYFDGNKTPEGVSCSYLIKNKDRVLFEETKILDSSLTVPEAEYYGLIYGIEKFLEYSNSKDINSKDVELEIYGDSQLVVKQINGEYECKKPNLRVLRSKVKDLLKDFLSYKIFWIPREKNLVR